MRVLPASLTESTRPVLEADPIINPFYSEEMEAQSPEPSETTVIILGGHCEDIYLTSVLLYLNISKLKGHLKVLLLGRKL